LIWRVKVSVWAGDAVVTIADSFYANIKLIYLPV